MGTLKAKAEILVGDYMTKRVVSISLDETLKLAQDIMGLGNIRHLPVVRGGKLIGVVSQRDLLRASLTTLLKHSTTDQNLFLESIHVSEVMTQKVQTATTKTSVQAAARMMLKKKIGCLPVVKKNGELAGLITETDVLRAFVDHFPQRASSKSRSLRKAVAGRRKD